MTSKLSILAAAAITTSALAASAIPQAAFADYRINQRSKAVTVYFTRHAEKKTTTESLGSATQLYQIPNPDEAPVGTDPTGNEVSKGDNRNDVCGTDKCAEELSDKGLHRANLLASWFKRQRVVKTLDAVYSSHKFRTYQTVMPTAVLANLDVVQLPAGKTELDPESTSPSECPTIEAIMATPPGDTILVAGHSGTLYDIMGDGNSDCVGLGLLTDDDPSTRRFPKDDDGKVRDFGDIWKVVIRDGVARLSYRVNLETTQLRAVSFAR